MEVKKAHLGYVEEVAKQIADHFKEIKAKCLPPYWLIVIVPNHKFHLFGKN
jgi:hypothetical protein